MTVPTDSSWIEWARDLVREDTPAARARVYESSRRLPNEVKLHWMPFALGMTDEALCNYMLNLELVSHDEYLQAIKECRTDRPSWIEILFQAGVAAYIEGSSGYFETTSWILKNFYPDLIAEFPSIQSISYRVREFRAESGDGIVELDNMFQDFLEHVGDKRRICWIDVSDNTDLNPVIFGIPENVDRLCRRFELGCTTVMPRLND